MSGELESEIESDSRPIGVFDSGVGGLTVLSELVSRLPGEQFIYLGDTARVPYGPRSAPTVLRYSREISAELIARGVKMVVIACNSATAQAEEHLRRELPLPVLGVIRPGVEALRHTSRNRRVGVIGTRATIRSGNYQRLIAELDADITLFSEACPLFVPLVEEGWIRGEVAERVVREYLQPMVEQNIDTLVLGCTHYPLLKATIHALYPHLTLVDSSAEMARAVEAALHDHRLASPASRAQASRQRVELLFTDLPEQLMRMLPTFFAHHYDSLSELNLSDE